ncbi:hypothetical protein [Salinibius halmophilus]|uniref:hypothetical protein n=1 Tax=Salinibius halmophilus TaxID=1853216 RepID=UPI000E6757B8|nr:hypothetical protein [Salinibius halmophilus]
MNHQMKITVIKKRSTDLRALIIPIIVITLTALLVGDDWQASLIYAFRLIVPMILIVFIVEYFVAPFVSSSLHYQIDEHRLRFGGKRVTY